MTKKETGKLFLLLEQFYPKRQKSDDLRLAWEMALKPYPYGEVKEAVLAHVRQSRFFPDIAEIVALLPTRDEPDEDDEPEQSAFADKHRISNLAKLVKKCEERYRDRTVNHVTAYAAENEISIGEAEQALGKTWYAAQYGGDL